MRIGISIATRQGQSIWENGLGQNVFFLVKLLRASPMVTDVVLLNCGPHASLPYEVEAILPGLVLVPVREATELIDVAIEMGGGLDVEWLDHLRARGKKTVFLCCGQPYVGLIEPTVFKRDGYFARAQRCDEVWILPKDRALRPMLETLHRCPVFEVPFLWDPMFVDYRIREVQRAGFSFGYVPAAEREGGHRPLRVAVFEPNISVVKCGVIPMLACDMAYRAAPQSVAEMRVLNSAHLQGHPTFDFLVRSLDLNSASKLHVDHRHDFVGYMAQFGDAVVAHQWQNDQNILHLDALYGGYPLVHNAEWLSQLGYYYEAFNAPAGAAQLIRAAEQHDQHFPEYRAHTRAFLEGLNPLAPENSAAYLQRLLHLGARGGREVTTW
jgi:hypothetical protein